MNIQRIKYILLLLILAAFACQTEKSTDLIFEGVVSGPWEGHSIHLYNNLTGERDSADIIDGRFSMVLPFSEPTRHMFFSTYDTRVKRGYAPFGILVEEPGTVHIELDIEKGFTQALISGSKPHQLYAELLDKQAATIQQHTTSAGERDTEAISGEVAAEIEKMVRENPSSFASAFVLDRMGDQLDLAVREELYELLPEALKQSHFGVRTFNLIQGLKRSAIGNKVEDFTLMNEKDEPVNFHAFLGQYVLIDFWASWCGPCIAEIPKFKEIYEKYRNDGFEIVGISIDKNHEAWLGAVSGHELPWPQLIDNEEDNIANSHFAVTAVPTTYLLDPDGKILIRNIKGEALDQKLSELLLK